MGEVTCDRSSGTNPALPTDPYDVNMGYQQRKEVNMAINPEFKAITTTLFAKGGFVPRAPYQRTIEFSDPASCMVAGCTFASQLPAGWSLEVLGVGPGYSSSGAVVYYDHIAVHTPDGSFPATRRTSVDGHYSVCSALQYVRG